MKPTLSSDIEVVPRVYYDLWYQITDILELYGLPVKATPEETLIWLKNYLQRDDEEDY